MVKDKKSDEYSNKLSEYRNQIKSYVHNMEKDGYSIESIKQQLHNHGHAKQVIEETITEVSHDAPNTKKKHKNKKQNLGNLKEIHKKEKPKQSKKNILSDFSKQDMLLAKERVFILLYFAGVLGMIFWLSSVNTAPLSKVFTSFVPTIITIIIVILVLETALQKIRAINWVVPILTSVGFYVLITPTGNSVLTNVDVGNITVANFIISMVFIIGLEFLLSMNQSGGGTTIGAGGKTTKVTTRKTTNELDLGGSANTEMSFQKQFQEYIQAIEDKCKAINFVIGRVYSNKHGGSEKLRESIKLKPEWYNEFSKINDENIDENMVVLKKVLWSLYDRLLLIGKKEREVFKKKEIINIKDLTRDKMGEETIIEVLANNDKDPIVTYYQSAVDFCKKATEELRALG